ncbi:putative actin binding protein [Heterostelium album PN500]|uniref:Putative actin binding protein n=1 Tax=Heterostelium pallidum (strain ATCC 26659 / Pp 5 / PN500) TaxID=670386 RepID=D3B4Q2_HETP5|nr:putative actin binding protein [Heterostelium album PN500]EFA84300.1 putative actin binding protein [Heterostelium album PN500]|eukprot:XP_020436416.1 putative actin binding protein [Heterostelium album PN500]
MEQLLEAVSDAVSSMVLYSVEADESNAAIPNILPGAHTVKTTVDYLVDLAAKSAVLWNNFNQPEMVTKMLESCENIRQACNDLLESATILSNMPFNKPAKKILLKGAKGIMEHMVILLQQADLYEVTRLIKKARLVESKLKVFIGLEPGESYFATAAQEFVTSTIDLGKIVNKRTNEIDDFGFKRRFEEANTQLKVEVPVVLQYYALYQRDPNDSSSYKQGSDVARKINDILEEIITVARLSAKSPFDLSMISGLDLRDEDDLRDAAIFIAHEKEKLLSAIESGDGKEASRALKAIKKGLNDQIVISKALAKSADNPVHKKRLEHAAQNAQMLLDSIIAEFGHQVEELLSKPDNALLLRELQANLDTIKTASDLMVTSSAKLTSNDVADSQNDLESAIERMKVDISKSDYQAARKDLNDITNQFNNMITILDGIAKSTEDPALKAHIESIMTQTRARGSTLLGHIERLLDQAAKNPNDPHIVAELNAKLDELEEMGRDVVKATSIGTSTDLYNKSSSIEEQLAKLRQAAHEGDKKEVQNGLRTIRKALYDELNIAKSIARSTDDEQLREALEAAILKAEENLQSMIEDLYKFANETVDDPTNSRAVQSLDNIIAMIDGLNSNLVGAVSRDLVETNTRELEAKISELASAIRNSQHETAVATLKEIITDIKKQAAISEPAANYIATTDEARANRVKDRAADLVAVGPNLVKAVKAVITDHSQENQLAVAQQITALVDTNRELTNAVLMTTEQEILENAAKIDADMRRIKKNLESGQPINMAEVKSLVRKMNNQIRLAHQHANTLKDPNAKRHLLESTDNLNKLVNLLVEACKNSLTDPETKRQISELLADIARANIGLFNDGTMLSAADELVLGTPNLLKLISKLEEAIASGDPDAIRLALKELQAEIQKQLFLARIAESSIDDPERRKQLQDAILHLETLNNSLYPQVMDFLNDPNNPAIRDGLNNLLRRLRDGVENVSAIAATSATEHLENKSIAVANELVKLEEAVQSNNTADANDHHQKAIQGIKQQIQLSKHIAEQTSNIPQRRAIIDLTEKLEKQALVLSAAVKESLANPNSAAAKAKLSEAAAATRVLMAQLIAASSNKVPEEQVAATAAAIKKDLSDLLDSLNSGKPEQIKAGLSEFKEGEQRQRLEQLKAYAANVQDPFLKRAINDAVSDLEKKLNETIKAASQAGPNPTADKLRTLKNLVESSTQASDKVIKAATPSSEDRILSQAVKICETLDRVQTSSKKGSKADVESNLKEYRDELNDTIHLIKQVADSTRDQHKKVALNELAEKLKNSQQPLANLANNAADKPADSKLQSELAAAIQQTKDILGRAATTASNNPTNLVEDSILKANNDINQLLAASQSGDQKSIGDAVTNLQDSEKRLKLVANASNDPNIKQSLQSLNTTLPVIIGAGNTLITAPKDPHAKQLIESHSKKAIEDLTNALSLANQTPEENIIINGTVVNNELDNLVKQAKKGDKNAIDSFAKTSHKSASEQALLARALASQTNNAQRKQELTAKANALEQALPQIEILSKNLQANPSDKASADKLEGLVQTMKVNNQKIVNEALAERADKEAKERAIRAEKERQEREQREKEERERAERDEVMAAAQKIQERTKDLVKDNSSEGKLYNTAQGIAGIMKDLSEAARSNDKKGMLTCSKMLSEQVNIYLQQAKETAAKCTDPKLKEQIITAAQAARNFTVQLKIIAAVKAASEDDDASTNKQQLIKCAKGLAKAVVQTINAVEVGRIRAK